MVHVRSGQTDGAAGFPSAQSLAVDDPRLTSAQSKLLGFLTFLLLGKEDEWAKSARVICYDVRAHAPTAVLRCCLAMRSERRVGVASSVLCDWRRVALRACSSQAKGPPHESARRHQRRSVPREVGAKRGLPMPLKPARYACTPAAARE